MSASIKDHDYMFKVILLGKSGVGKSNILLRCTKNEFVCNCDSTLGVEYATKIITTSSGIRIKLQIWDTAGQEKYRSLMRTYYKGASAAVIVYDITKETSFQNVQREINTMKDFTKTDLISMIIGNKADLHEQRAVSKQKAIQYAQQKRMAFYQTSAKTGQNVELVFQNLAEEFERAITDQERKIYERTTKVNKDSITIYQSNYGSAKKQCCK